MLLIAITALTRKIVVLDSQPSDGLYLIGQPVACPNRRQRGAKTLGNHGPFP